MRMRAALETFNVYKSPAFFAASSDWWSVAVTTVIVWKPGCKSAFITIYGKATPPRQAVIGQRAFQPMFRMFQSRHYCVDLSAQTYFVVFINLF